MAVSDFGSLGPAQDPECVFAQLQRITSAIIGIGAAYFEIDLSHATCFGMIMPAQCCSVRAGVLSGTRQPRALVVGHENTSDLAPLHKPHAPRRAVVALCRAEPELPAQAAAPREDLAALRTGAVSYTHLTLPTIAKV